MTPFLGIYREPICSPGRHLENDRTILELAARHLETRGHRVALSSADDAERAGRDASVVFSMSRSPRCLELLTRWEREGKTIVNRPRAVIDTARDRLARREIKFYAVGPERFFHWLGADEAAGRLPRRDFQVPATAAGTSVALEVFGGDIVIRGDGRIVLIDLNDWPSFAPCPDAGARAIAGHLEARLADSYAVASPARPAPSA